jgi:adenylate cyclase
MADRIATFQRWAKLEVERHHGIVDKFAGDAVMATFNVSGMTIDHTRHALDAAVALRDKAALMGLPIGLGIATGAAIVGALVPGANVSVLGETTNLAARLQSQAAAGEVLLSAEAYKRLVGIDGRREALELKGFSEPVTAYRLK